MEQPRRLSTLELLGGDAALDLANTLEGPRGARPVFDWLPDYDALVAWSEHAGLLRGAAADALRARAGGSAAARAHRDAVRLRATLGEIFAAIAAGDPAPEAGLRALLRAHRAALAHAALAPAGGPYAVTWSSDLGRPWWPAALAAIDLLRSERLGRLKGCARCSWLFLDQTRNGSRRWCSMADCGTAEKMRRRALRSSGRAGYGSPPSWRAPSPGTS